MTEPVVNPADEVSTEALRLPVLPLFETVVFPHMMQPIQVGRQPSLLAVDEAVKHRPHRIVLLTQNEASKQDVGPDDLMPIGVLATIGPMFRLPDGSVQLLAQGDQRVRVLDYTKTDPYLEVEAEIVAQEAEPSTELTALMEAVKEALQQVHQSARQPARRRALERTRCRGPVVARRPRRPHAGTLESDERKELLTTLDVTERLHTAHRLLSEEVEVLELKSRISSEVQKNIDKTQREYLLREQMKAIQRELGELDAEAGRGGTSGASKIEAAGMPEKAQEKADKEVDRLERMPAASPEVGMIRTYLDWLVGMPWSVSTEDQLDIAAAAEHARSRTTTAWRRSRSASSNTWRCASWPPSCAARSSASSARPASARPASASPIAARAGPQVRAHVAGRRA